VVLAVTLVVTLIYVPTALWRQFLTEIGASAIYVVNWVLATNAVDYFAAENTASPVQHYWSLSVEEQFYIVWPLLIIGVYWATRRLQRHSKHAVLAGVFGLVFIASLIVSVVGAETNQSFTYFATTAHAWEFAAGGLLAIAGLRKYALVDRFTQWRGALASRAVLSWLGFISIVASALIFDGESKFPGWIALLPVVGTLAVIVAGDPRALFGPGFIVRNRFVQFVGDVSYSAYLWHWPLIVLVPFVIARDLGTAERLVILAATLGLAWVSERYVEDVVRATPVMAKRSRTYVAAAMASTLLLAGCVAPVVAHESRKDAVRAYVNAAIASGDKCFGGRALVDGVNCEFATNVDPEVGDDPKLYNYPLETSVCGYPVPEIVRDCLWGSEEPTAKIALIGDSHMGHYRAAFAGMLNENAWEYHLITHNTCPIVSLDWTRTTPGAAGDSESCRLWRGEVITYIADSADLDAVVVSNYSQKFAQIETAENRATMARAYAETWSQWTDAGIPVIVIADDPLTNKQNVPACVRANADDLAKCSLPREEAVGKDPLVAAAKEYPNPGATLVDLTDSYCDDDRCYVVVGGVVVYSDTHHISAAFSRSLYPLIEPHVAAALAGQ
jgi:peptidoglycan/LPS O-acetylase OafA/YrhL